VDGASSEKALVESINRMSFDSRVRNRSRIIPWSPRSSISMRPRSSSRKSRRKNWG
jgi:hypothetical protein